MGVRLRLRVNGEARTAEVEPRLSLADFLRQTLGLTGTHVGCEMGACGACTVLVDGEPVRACLLLAVQAAGADVRTVESLGRPEALHPLQAASADPLVRTASFDAATCTFSVPARTAAVFWATRPAAQQLALLAAEIDGLVADGTLDHGQGRALKAKLEAAQKKLRQGHDGPAAHQVGAFIHQVEALAAAGVLSPERAGDLIADAEAILEELEG